MMWWSHRFWTPPFNTRYSCLHASLRAMSFLYRQAMFLRKTKIIGRGDVEIILICAILD